VRVALVQVAASCKKGGAATNIIYGLALGYLSTIVPIFILASVIFIAFSLCDTCVALAVDRLPTLFLCVCCS
jgi:inorganic pyrophosphatase